MTHSPSKLAKPRAPRVLPWIDQRRRIIYDRCNVGQTLMFPYRRILGRKLSDKQDIMLVDLERYKISLFLRVLGVEETSWMQFNELEECDFHEAFVGPTLLAHDDLEDALIIGGGDLLVANELIKCPMIQRITIADWDPLVAKMVKKHYPKIARSGVHRDKRISGIGIARNVRTFLPNLAVQYNLVIVDLSDVAVMNTLVPNFLHHIRRILRPGGIVVFQVGSASRFEPEETVLARNANLLARAFGGIEYIDFWHVAQYGFGYPQGYLAARNGVPFPRRVPTDGEIRARFPRWQDLSFYSVETHQSMHALGRLHRRALGLAPIILTH